MSIKLVDCFDWNAPNRPGVLFRHSAELKKRGVNLSGVWCYVSSGRPRIAAIGRDAGKLGRALRAMKIRARRSKVFYLTGRDKPGALLGPLRKLADARINVTCLDAVAVQGRFGAVLSVNPNAMRRARRLLKA